MNLFLRTTLLLALPLALAACGERTDPAATSPGPSAQGIPASQAPSLEAVRSYAQGFDTGAKRSARQVFVFFDPQCPSCLLSREDTAKLEAVSRITWVPVAVVNPASMAQGAAILVAENPGAALAGVVAQQSVPALETLDANAAAAVTQNTRLLASFGVTAVPYLVAKNLATGKVFASAQTLSADQLFEALGWATIEETAIPDPGPKAR